MNLCRQASKPSKTLSDAAGLSSIFLRQLATAENPGQAEASTSASEPVDWDPPQYHRSGSVEGRYTVTRKPVFAVVEVGATQFKVSPDDLIWSEKLKGVTVNDKLSLMRVLMLGSETETVIGRPFIPQASVSAAVEEQTLDAKVIIFHKRRRKNSKKTKGHRQELTALRILDIEGLEPAEPAEYLEAASA